jgi:hypothetical protein
VSDGERAQAAEGGPLAEVRLADGQTVRAVVRRRLQEWDGSWWYEMELPLWARVETPDGRLTAEPDSTLFLAPWPKAVSPVEGQDYRSVPTKRHPTAIRRAAQKRSYGRRSQPQPWGA